MALQKDLTEPQIDLRAPQNNKKNLPKKDSLHNTQKSSLPKANQNNPKSSLNIIPLKKEPALVPDGEYAFPENFLWGTSTSAYQVEGGIKNDWSEWETSKERKAELKKQGEKPNDFICGQACDFFHKYAEDIALAKNLNNNAIRIGLEWSRIQPERETWSIDALNYYRQVLAEAKSQGLQTVVTLWHWTNPLWIAENGGWTNKKTIIAYQKYVEIIIKELGGSVDYWLTLNEPLMHVFGGYLKGYFPPQKHNIFKAEKVFKNLVSAHCQAYELIHKHFPNSRVSLTALVNYFEAAHSWNPLEQLLSKSLHYFWNHRFLKKIKNQMDFIGLDYYFHDRLVFYPPWRKNLNKRCNDKGWEIYPEGILPVLEYLANFKKPIYIMENGIADAKDSRRGAFIQEHLYYIYKAIEKGIDVRGYFHWSLLDNFEWSYGWSPKFGLYELDRNTMERKERPSASVYRDICAQNRLKII